MEKLIKHIDFIKEMILNIKTDDYRKKWENILYKIENENITHAEIEIINKNIEKAKEIKQKYKNEPKYQKEESCKDNKKQLSREERNRINELKKLHENIVKNDKPLPLKRIVAKRTSSDFIDFQEISGKKRKSESIDEKSVPVSQKMKSSTLKPILQSKNEKSFKVVDQQLPKNENQIECPTLYATVNIKVNDSDDNDGLIMIQNMSYTTTPSGFKFNCLISDCKFETNENETFLDHLESEQHMSVKWSGECAACKKRITEKPRSIIFELMHMREDHLLKEKTSIKTKMPSRETNDEKVGSSNSISKVEANSGNVVKKIFTPEMTKREPGKMVKICLIPAKELEKPREKHNAPSTSKDKVIKIPLSKPIATDESMKIKKHVIVKPSPIPMQKGESSSNRSVDSVALKNEKVETLYKIDTSSNSNDLLRPWLKRKVKKYIVPATQLLSNKAALVANYKCMGGKCSFFTCDKKLFETHLKLHESFVPADKDYLNCAFCDYRFIDNAEVKDVINHINNEHCFDRFQCPYCFYRSRVSHNLLIHQSIYHSAKPRGIFVLESNKDYNATAEFEMIKTNASKFVPGLNCDRCKAKFYIFEDLKSHLDEPHQTSECNYWHCKKCNEIVRSKAIFQHSSYCDSIGLYHCLYCLFGTNTLQILVNHIAASHPSKLPIFCERTRSSPGSASSIDITTFKHLSQKIDSRVFIHYSADKDVLRNEHAVVELGGKIKIRCVTESAKE